MAKDLYFTILSRLAKRGVGVQTNISDLFKIKHIKPEIKDELGLERKRYLAEYLKRMEDSQHIKCTLTDLEPEIVVRKKWVNPYDIKAEITLLGLQCYFDHRLKRVTINSILYTKWTAGIAIVVSVAAIAATLYVADYSSEIKARLSTVESQLRKEKARSQRISNPVVHTPNSPLKKKSGAESK